MLSRNTNVTSKQTAETLMVAAATICGGTTIMGTAAANGATHTLLDSITIIAVVGFACLGAAVNRRSKRHNAGNACSAKAVHAEAEPRKATLPRAENPKTPPAPTATNVNSTQSHSLEKRACLALAQAHDLSLRERDVLELMATGITGKEIATELMLSYNTVKSHIRHIYAKLDVHRKQDLADLIEQQRQQFEQ